MANKQLFRSLPGQWIPPANMRNDAGGLAYGFSAKHMLAQYAATGCLNATFYAGAPEQLATVLESCAKVDATFVAKTAIYARQKGQMKDLPALLCAVLAVKAPELLRPVFRRVIANGKMLRNFVQIIRSGVVGRKSLGTLPKRLVREWLAHQDEIALFKASVGNDPSLADVIKMVHPIPATAERAAFYGYVLGRQHDAMLLPKEIRQFEAFKAGDRSITPDVPFQMLTALDLSVVDWCEIARRASWQTLRANLNTLARHGVFAEPGMAELVASRLSDIEEIRRAKVFPYQLLMAFRMANPTLPAVVRDALQEAMEHAIANVPVFTGQVVVCPDVSGSMQTAVTGYRAGATSTVRCVDVAALIAAAVVRQNPSTQVMPFDVRVRDVRLNARDSVMTNADRLAAVGGGGTNCSAPLAELNRFNARADVVVMVSDNESWMDPLRGQGTATMQQWNVFKQRNPDARLVCIDLQPNRTTQAIDRSDILNVGGFNDAVFDIINVFVQGKGSPEHWVRVIENISLEMDYS